MKSIYVIVSIFAIVFLSVMPDYTTSCKIENRYDCCFLGTQKCCMVGSKGRVVCYDISR